MDYQDYLSLGQVDRDYWYFKGIRMLLEKILDIYLSNKNNLSEQTKPKILNIGCGAGEDLELFAKYGEIVSIDVNEEVSRLLPQAFASRFFLMSAEKLAFENESFEAVLAIDVLEHIKHDGLAMAEIHRVLKPGGLAIILIPMHAWIYGPMDRYALHYRRYSKRGFFELIGNVFEVQLLNWWLSAVALPGGVLKLVRKFLMPNSKTSELIPLPKLLNSFLTFLMFLDVCAITRRISLPFGLSMVAVLKKKRAVSYQPLNQPNNIESFD